MSTSSLLSFLRDVLHRFDFCLLKQALQKSSFALFLLLKGRQHLYTFVLEDLSSGYLHMPLFKVFLLRLY